MKHVSFVAMIVSVVGCGVLKKPASGAKSSPGSGATSTSTAASTSLKVNADSSFALPSTATVAYGPSFDCGTQDGFEADVSTGAGANTLIRFSASNTVKPGTYALPMVDSDEAGLFSGKDQLQVAWAAPADGSLETASLTGATVVLSSLPTVSGTPDPSTFKGDYQGSLTAQIKIAYQDGKTLDFTIDASGQPGLGTESCSNP